MTRKTKTWILRGLSAGAGAAAAAHAASNDLTGESKLIAVALAGVAATLATLSIDLPPKWKAVRWVLRAAAAGAGAAATANAASENLTGTAKLTAVGLAGLTTALIALSVNLGQDKLPEAPPVPPSEAVTK